MLRGRGLRHWTRRMVFAAKVLCLSLSPKAAVRYALRDRAFAGALGERLAARFLCNKAGLSLLVRNYRAVGGELDLVCRKGDSLIFVEVRTRRAEALVSGYHSLDSAKRAKVVETAQAYLNALRRKPVSVRYDVVEIRLHKDGRSELYHYEGVPLVERR